MSTSTKLNEQSSDHVLGQIVIEASLAGTSIDTIHINQLETILFRTCQHYDLKGYLSVAIVDEDRIRQLNRDYRNVDEATDVLTFPSAHPAGTSTLEIAGDIAICLPFAARQAEQRGVSCSEELAALLVHGVLHLAGFDDIEDEDRKVMQTEMAKIGEKLSLQIDAEWTSLLH